MNPGTIPSFLAYAGLCLLLLLPGWTAGAQAGAERDFASSLTIDDTAFALHGTGVLRFKRIVPVYDAALYVGKDATGADVLDDVPKRIEVQYRVGTEAERFGHAGEKILARMFSTDELASVRTRLDRINGWYPDPRPGDRCAITYIPGRGTRLTFNGESLGRIEGADFARIYFSIWLGPEPASIRLRDGLLNGQAR